MKKSQMLRIVEFDSLVREGKYPNSVRFSLDYEVSQRTILRDIAYLRDQLGAPLEYDSYRKGFCYKSTWCIPQTISISAMVETTPLNAIKLLERLDRSTKETILNWLIDELDSHSTTNKTPKASAA